MNPTEVLYLDPGSALADPLIWIRAYCSRSRRLFLFKSQEVEKWSVGRGSVNVPEKICTLGSTSSKGCAAAFRHQWRLTTVMLSLRITDFVWTTEDICNDLKQKLDSRIQVLLQVKQATFSSWTSAPCRTVAILRRTYSQSWLFVLSGRFCVGQLFAIRH